MPSYESVISAESSLRYWWPIYQSAHADELKDSNGGGTWNGAVAGAPGLPGSIYSATRFTAGYFIAPLVTNLTFPSSIEVWFQSTTVNDCFMQFQSTNGLDWNAGLGFGQGTGAGTNVASSTTVGLYDFGTSGDWRYDGNKGDGNWHHAVGSMTSNTATLYVDSVLIGTNSGGGNGQTIGSGNWQIGLGRGYTMTGVLAHAAVYTSALSQAQVTAHYQAGITRLTNVFSVRDPQAYRVPGIN